MENSQAHDTPFGGCAQPETELERQFGQDAANSITLHEFIVFNNEIRKKLNLPLISINSPYDMVTACKMRGIHSYIEIPKIYYAVMIEIYFDYWL